MTLLATAVFAVALAKGSFVAGGSDSYGYVSQARLWAQGTPITREPLIAQVTWPDAPMTLSPLGYKPGREHGTIVPVYSVGYPMLMGLIERLFGAAAPMVVVPLMAGGLVTCTAIIGAAVGGIEIGFFSGLLLATSPPFVYQSLQPMSDVPVAFWWTLSAVLAISRRRAANIAAGATVAAAILTRPNLVPLAAPLALLGFVSHRDNHRDRWTAAAAIGIGAVLGAAGTAAVNTIFYGAPALSGYGDPRELYAFQYLATNVTRYVGWLIDTETLLIAGSLGGMLALARAGRFQRSMAFYTAAMVSIVLISYALYRPFDSWTYVRFLLPMYPFLFVSLLSVTLIDPLRNRRTMSRVILVALALIITARHVRYNQEWSLLDTKTFERRYVVVAQYARNAFPGNAVFISMQHSGSVRYYGDRKTVRYDWLPSQSLDDAVADLNRLGLKPYFLLEDWEEERFQSRFGAYSRLGKLDWPPTVVLRREGIRIYDPAER